MAVSLAQKYPPFRPRGHTSGVPPIPGGGPAQAYLRAAPKHVAALLMFCAEGDNRGDAQELALRAADLCGEPLGMYLATTVLRDSRTARRAAQLGVSIWRRARATAVQLRQHLGDKACRVQVRGAVPLKPRVRPRGEVHGLGRHLGKTRHIEAVRRAIDTRPHTCLLYTSPSPRDRG